MVSREDAASNDGGSATETFVRPATIHASGGVADTATESRDKNGRLTCVTAEERGHHAWADATSIAKGAGPRSHSTVVDQLVAADR